MDDSPCVIWTGHIRPRDGYGIHHSGRMAHRVIWEREAGPIPDGMELDHRCRTRACVNVQHLELVDRAENIRRSVHRNSLKTHCPKGHPLDYAHGGKRHCSTCRAARGRARRLAKDTCSKGHPFDAVRSNGTRQCSICAREAGKTAMASRWGNRKT